MRKSLRVLGRPSLSVAPARSGCSVRRNSTSIKPRAVLPRGGLAQYLGGYRRIVDRPYLLDLSSRPCFQLTCNASQPSSICRPKAIVNFHLPARLEESMVQPTKNKRRSCDDRRFVEGTGCTQPLLRRKNPNPAKAIPNNPSVAGSGTGTGPFAEKSPATLAVKLFNVPVAPPVRPIP
jgi:hypothetical protein